MAGIYDHKKLEKKWQEKWEKESAFAAEENSKKEKLYILDMFPYPSGSGLHVGHVEGYTATDIYSRFKRMQGYNVLHPMGWDAFGLPAENYAIKTGIPPAKTTNDAINTFRKQIKNLGLSYDWSREVGAHTPEYYKWTQWFFLFLYKQGLAYKKKAFVNWDPVDQTVLANEQVLPDGTAERSGAKVEQRELEQWFFKITDYADSLIDDLDEVDWPESTKINQRNWIGRSEGAEIDFYLNFTKNPRDNQRRGPDGKAAHIPVFTTRPDTLFGATYLVLAPEHLWVQLATDDNHDVLENKDEIRAYVEQAKNKTALERQESKEKTGVEIKGVKAINPANKEEIPIYVADYVLGGYGTGAIMAVPAHDERDYAFAMTFKLPIRQVIEPTYTQATEPGIPKEGMPYDHREAIIAIVKHWRDDTYMALKWKKVAWGTFITGGIEAGQTPQEAAKMEIEQETGYTHVKFIKNFGIVHGKFYHLPKQVNRNAHAHVLYFELQDGEQKEISTEESDIHDIVWLSIAELKKFLTPPTHHHGLRWLLGDTTPYTAEGTLANSGEFNRLESAEAKNKIIEAVGGKWVKTYRLRDWLISRQRYWGAPIPVVYDPNGQPHPIPEEHLPWMLPTDVEFKPTGTSPLGQSKELLLRTEKIFGKGWRPEIDTMDTFVCSSWYYYRFADPKNDEEFASKEQMQRWLPVDLYMGGAEHTVLHLMYARFFTKVLQKYGYVDFGEPFLKLRHQGTILAEDGSKMSKSKGNVINPDDVVERYGADTLRLYEMFMGPLESMKPWNTKNILGVRRFLERIWRLREKVSSTAVILPEVDALLQQTIKKVGEDFENLKMNTAISSLMILLNKLEEGAVDKDTYKIFLRLLAPLAPHIAEEIWEQMGEKSMIYHTDWPTYDASKLTSQTIKIAVQVNGKVRGTIELSKEVGEKEALTAARADLTVQKWLLLGKEEKAVYVPGKIVSFVVR